MKSYTVTRSWRILFPKAGNEGNHCLVKTAAYYSAREQLRPQAGYSTESFPIRVRAMMDVRCMGGDRGAQFDAVHHAGGL